MRSYSCTLIVQGGYGMYFAGRWAQGIWPKSWVDTGMTRDMTLLELFPVIAALDLGYTLKKQESALSCRQSSGSANHQYEN